MREMAALHQQLQRMLAMPSALKQIQGLAHHGAAHLANMCLTSAAILEPDVSTKSLTKPGKAYDKALRRCIVAALPDQVARRVRPQEHLQQLAASVRCCAAFLLCHWQSRSVPVKRMHQMHETLL